MYSYDIRILKASRFFKSYTNNIPIGNAQDMIIRSKSFDTFDSCERSFFDLMYFLMQIEISETDKRYILVTQNNPLVYSSDNEDKILNENVLYKTFVTEHASIKEKVPVFTAYGQVKVDAYVDKMSNDDLL